MTIVTSPMTSTAQNRTVVTEHYYAIHEPGKWADEDISGVLRRTLKDGDKWFDEIWSASKQWEWSPIYLHKDYASDHAYRFSVITEGEAETIIKRLDRR
jgi:hypothetical protein